MAKLLLGKEVNASLNERVRSKAARLREAGITPTLAILRVGERPDDLAYEKGARKRHEALGIDCRSVVLPAEARQEELLAAVEELNRDASVHGVLMLRPLPAHIDERLVCGALRAEKDVDGQTEASMAGVFTGSGVGFAPCTAQACMEILAHYGIDCAGRRAVVVGRSLIVGKPAAMLLLQKNATVTVCHTRTADLVEVTRQADILLVAAGRAGVIGAEHVSEGQIVIDVGIHMGADGRLCGDVDFDAVSPVVEAITPVPGGVGSVTTSVLAEHVTEAALRMYRDRQSRIYIRQETF